jgi:hypothetical protein
VLPDFAANAAGATTKGAIPRSEVPITLVLGTSLSASFDIAEQQSEEIEGRGDSPNRHDILPGSGAQGMAIADMICNDWTSNGEGQAMIGHHDRACVTMLRRNPGTRLTRPGAGIAVERR